MKFPQAILPALLLVRAVPAAADSLTDLFPPETKVVLGIRVHNIANSALVQGLATQAKTAGAEWLKLVSMTGFDPLQDIDEVLIATNAQTQNAPALVVITGRFDVARLTGGANRYHDVPVVGEEKAGNAAFALLDASTAIAGDANLIRAAIDRRAAGAKIDAALNDRITSMRQRYDVWGLGERPEGFAAPMPEAQALESIDRFQFGVQLSSGLELNAEIHARSSQDADKLTETLQMVSAFLKAQQPAKNGAKFDLQAEGGTVKLALFIPEAEIRKMMQPERTTWTSTDEPASGPLPEVAAATPPPVAPPPPQTPADPPKPVGKPVTHALESQVLDKEGNTIILKLPGKK